MSYFLSAVSEVLVIIYVVYSFFFEVSVVLSWRYGGTHCCFGNNFHMHL